MKSLFKLDSNLSLIFLLALSVLVITSGGYFFYQYQVEVLKEEKFKQLRIFSQQKSKQIQNWREERIFEADLISKSFRAAEKIGPISLMEEIKDFPKLRSFLKEIISEDNYEEAIITNSDKKVLMTVSDRKINLHEIESAHIDTAVKYRSPILTKIFRTGEDHFIRQSLVIPILSSAQISEVVFLIILRINPQEELFPMVQQWPDESESAEALLLRRENGTVVFINPPKFEKVRPLEKRISISESTLVSVKAAMGYDTVLEGNDYRDVPVVAAMTRVGETNWFFLAKIDEDEIYEVIKTRTILIWSIIVLLVGVISLVIYFVWKHQKYMFQQKEMQLELERKNISTQYESLCKYANDIILIFDKEGRIIEANNRALSAYGYEKKEMLNLNINALSTSKHTIIDLSEIFRSNSYENGHVFEITHVRKDGSVFPVEVSMNLIQLEDKNYCQSIIRDITERKNAEEKVKRSEKYFKSLLQNMIDVVVLIDEHAVIRYASPSLKNVLGYEESDYVGKNSFEFIYDDDKEKVRNIFQSILNSSRSNEPRQMRMLHKNGSAVWIGN